MKYKIILLIIFCLILRSHNALADVITKTITIGTDGNTYTETEKKDPIPQQPIVNDPVTINPVITVPYQQLYPYYYPAVQPIRFPNQPFHCYLPNCDSRRQYATFNGGYNGVIQNASSPKIYTNFSGGYNYGGNPRNWSATPINGPYMNRPPHRNNAGINVQIK